MYGVGSCSHVSASVIHSNPAAVGTLTGFDELEAPILVERPHGPALIGQWVV